MADFDDSAGRYDDDRYERRDRSASPRGDRDEPARSRSPNGRDRPPPPPSDTRMKDLDDEGAVNSGSNLFVTGIHPSLSEADITRMFEKYGDVENCSIMLDPHTKESRGFGFVKMVTSDQADAAKDGLQGEQMQGRTLSIEKARRGKPRTPTPGKYFGPPKRGDHRGPPPRGGGYRDRYDDRRGGYGPRRDDFRGGSRYYDDFDRGSRGYGGGGGRRDRDDNYSGRGGIDRYEGGRRDDTYVGGGSGGYGGRDGGRDAGRDAYGPPRERRGGGGGGAGYYDRDDRAYGAPPPRDEPPREAYSGGGRDYGREDRYAAR